MRPGPICLLDTGESEKVKRGGKSLFPAARPEKEGRSTRHSKQGLKTGTGPGWKGAGPRGVDELSGCGVVQRVLESRLSGTVFAT